MRHFVLNADQHGKLQAAIEMEGDATGYELSVSVRSLKDGKEMADSMWFMHFWWMRTNPEAYNSKFLVYDVVSSIKDEINIY